MAKKDKKLKKEVEALAKRFEQESARNNKRIEKLEESVKAQGGQIDSTTKWIASQTNQAPAPVVTTEFSAKKAGKNQSA